MSEELRPCPFCGGELPVHYTVMKNQYVQLISCPDCNATVVSTKFRSDRDALAIWQTRPVEDALTARIAELEAERRWIPVGERLPDNWKPVLTIDMSESTRVPVPAFYDPETSLWSTHLPNYDLWVTHWMPLPPNPESPNDTQTQTVVYRKESEE